MCFNCDFFSLTRGQLRLVRADLEAGHLALVLQGADQVGGQADGVAIDGKGGFLLLLFWEFIDFAKK